LKNINNEDKFKYQARKVRFSKANEAAHENAIINR
jgi:hypothetical protein